MWLGGFQPVSMACKYTVPLANSLADMSACLACSAKKVSR